MSGIFGIFNTDNQPASAENLARMSEALSSLGPESGETWLHGCTGLGQRRMIFTREDRLETQPLSASEDGLVCVWDGRLDNRVELAAVVCPGMDPASISNTELVLRAYRRWGTASINHMYGEFALALWDVIHAQLFLARSPISAPPLHFFTARGTLAFATMPRGLFALPGVPRALNDRKIAAYLTATRAEPNTTFYKNIYTLPSGYWMLVNPHGSRLENSWQPDLSRTLSMADEREYIPAFQELFERVVSDHLRGESLPAVMMSGGLDSASIAAQAAHILSHRGAQLATFTEASREGFTGAVMGQRLSDESHLVRAAARLHPNMQVNIMRTPGGFFLDDVETLFEHLEMPFRNTSNRVWYEAILREAAGRNLRTIITGGQGNITVSWDGNGLLSGLIAGGKFKQAWEQAGLLAKRGAQHGRIPLLLANGLLPFMPNFVWLTTKRLQNRFSPSAANWVEDTLVNPAYAAEIGLAQEIASAENRLRMRATRDTRSVRYKALCYQDGGQYPSAYRSMYGVDIRSPLADRRIAEFCLSLPESQYLWDGEPRRLIRRAMSGLLPTEVLANRRRGLQAADWFERLHAARPQVLDTLDALEKNPQAARMLNLPKMRGLMLSMPPANEPDFNKIARYRFQFEPALMAGRFICWFEESR